MAFAYYSEIDERAVAWLNELIKARVIADGVVDSRPMQEVDSDDLRGFDQCHFFAGIGVWSYALRLAGWPDDRQVWTGSCPCQPFSASGKRKGFADDRHLWPYWIGHIAERRPPVLFGEQVASPDGLTWFDLVSADLEAQDYAVGASDLCAAGVGAPHIRQRLYFVADTDDARSQGRGRTELRERADQFVAGAGGASGELGYPESAVGRLPVCELRSQQDQPESRGAGEIGELADANGGQQSDGDIQRSGGHRLGAENATTGFWDPAEWIYCRDGKFRPVEPGSLPLAHGAPARLGRLRGYGNAIVPHVAATFIHAYLDARGGLA